MDFALVSDSVSGENESSVQKCGERLLNPFLLELNLTKWTSIPSYIILVTSSVLILYIVMKRYKANLNIYFSVLWYIFTQTQFLLVTTISWITESTTAKRLEDCQFEEGCKIKMPVQTYSIMLPGYAVLMVTLVRTVFVSRPLSYFDYIRRRYQVFGAVLSVVLCGILSSLPSMGALCDIIVNRAEVKNQTSELGGYFYYCSYDGQSCNIYFALLIGLGSILPVILISGLYIYIYRVTVNARMAHEALTLAGSKTAGGCSQDEVMVKENRNVNKISKECGRPPWSVLAILVVFVASSTPWILLQVLKEEVTKYVMRERQTGARMFDVFYALVQFSVGISVLIYLLTTTSLRSACFLLIKQRHKQTSTMSSINRICPS